MKKPKRIARPHVVWNGSYKHATLDKIEVRTCYWAYAKKNCYNVVCNCQINRVYDRNPENDKWFNLPPNLDAMLTGQMYIAPTKLMERIKEIGIEDSWTYATAAWRSICHEVD